MVLCVVVVGVGGKGSGLAACKIWQGTCPTQQWLLSSIILSTIHTCCHE